MNTNDLYLEYARVIKMCEGTDLEDTPWFCVKINGTELDPARIIHPSFTREPNLYSFAVAVLEGKPVWIDSKIYAKSPNYDMLNGAIVTRTVHGNLVAQFDDGTQIQIYGFENGLETYFTWTPPPPTPNRTFTLNGVELPCPVGYSSVEKRYSFEIEDSIFYFDSIKNRNTVSYHLINLLTEARDK